MIQMPLPVAAASPAGMVPLAGTMPDQGAEAAPAGDFAAILALGLMPDAAQTAAPPHPAPDENPAAIPAAGGKPGGNVLPDGLPVDPASPALPEGLAPLLPEAEAPQASPIDAGAAEPLAVAPILLAMALPVAVPVAAAHPATPANPPAAALPPAALPDAMTKAPEPGPADSEPAAAPQMAVAIQAGGRQFGLPSAARAQAPDAPAALPAPDGEEPESPRPALSAEPVRKPAADSRPPLAPAPPVATSAPEMPALAIAPATVTPSGAMPAVQALATPAQPHDFTALVDRLVEARSLAQAGQSVQVVHTAIAHAEFGAVSLRFDARAEGLSVALSSADPDFNRAVLAAAPAAASADTGSQPGRGEAQNPAHNAGQPGAQSSAHNGQNGQRAASAASEAEAARARPHAASTDEPEARPARQSGIFA
ncbi:MAG TPA: hypothetical protein PKC84_18080 [Paracoccaceae bacterium]|nr:hypothetical protein [Paracoccaceae bacterium]